MAEIDVQKFLGDGTWKKRRLFFEGFIRYRDTFGTCYITGFNAAFSPEHNQWALRGDSEYNYTRVENADEIPPHPTMRP